MISLSKYKPYVDMITLIIKLSTLIVFYGIPTITIIFNDTLSKCDFTLEIMTVYKNDGQHAMV